MRIEGKGLIDRTKPVRFSFDGRDYTGYKGDTLASALLAAVTPVAAEVLDADGWLKTGDVAVIDPDGFVRIVDRKKDLIIVSGFNVYPNEIEDVLMTHPQVASCAVIGVPDERSGEAVKLFVVPRAGGVTVDELKAFCRENFTGYKVPRHIVLRDALPMSPVGKILRRELRDIA